MHPVLAELLKRAPVLSDGAWGTQLQARGLPVGACPDEWNLSHAAEVESVARAYVDAGSRVILTNTFGGTRVQLARHGLADRTVEINRAGAAISRRAAGTRAKVFASIGPTGKMLMMEEITEDEMRAAFAEQAQALKDGGADGLVVETMSDLAEAKLALQAARATGLPVVASMTFDAGADHDRTMMGVTIEDAARELEAAGADALGSNCGQGIEGFVAVCRRMRAVTSLPLWMKANAGLPVMQEGKVHYATTPAQFVAHVPALKAAGASFIGGCCGTSPDFIRAVAACLAAAG